jgi:prepilin-type N-terminal cleavage/methylation domain-containing protein
MPVTPASTANRGFTLVELLVAIAIVLILSALSFGITRATRTNRDLAQSAVQISHALEYAKALAQSQGESVFFVVADEGEDDEGEETSPPEAALRAWTLLRRIEDPDENPELIREWSYLPKKAFFVEDTIEQGEGDLLGEPLEPFLIVASDDSSVSGPVRVLVEITPEGRFVGSSTANLRMVLQGGIGDEDEEAVPGALSVRLRLRPLTGVVVVERVLP